MTIGNRTRLSAVAFIAVLGTASSARVQAGRMAPLALTPSAASASASACAANVDPLHPAPFGPCQCYPGGSSSNHAFVFGQWGSDLEGCQAAAEVCKGSLTERVHCDQGSPCNVNYYAALSSCRYVTCNGVRCGYEIDCSVNWGCRYCD